MVDFGRELYTPWRLSQGAVLYRDVDDVYGPLSQYFNAGLFKLFGPGLMVLVSANLVILGTIVALSYRLFRRAWGVPGALAACTAFVCLFAFNQSFYLSNFNYVTPYAHEATHGVLVCLGLVAALVGWIEAPTRRGTFVVGIMAGLTLVLKPEFILAAGAVVAAAALLRWRQGARTLGQEVLIFALGAVLPMALFGAYFSLHFPPREAMIAAGRAWTSLLVYPDFVGMRYQQVFAGLDQPWENLGSHLGKSLIALVILLAAGGWLTQALRSTGRPRAGLLGTLAVAAFAVGLSLRIDHLGACLLVLLLLYLGWHGTGLSRARARIGPGSKSVTNARILLAVLAVALMARMVLNGRIVQFGFFQAAVATMVVMAILFSEAGEWLPPARGRNWAVGLVAAVLVVPGVVRHVALSHHYQRLQTLSIGPARDRFFSYPPEIDPTGFNVNAVVQALGRLPPGTLLTLPEGSMINYLARRPSPLPQFQYYGFTTEGGREAAIVAALETRPPDFVVIASRDLRDFGIPVYGARDGAGRQILRWISSRYEITHKFDDDPLDSAQSGAYIMQRKPPAAGGG